MYRCLTVNVTQIIWWRHWNGISTAALDDAYFIFSAPPAFPDVLALAPESFILKPYPSESDVQALFVMTAETDGAWDIEERFAPVAADLVGAENIGDWSLASVQLLGWEGRYGHSRGASGEAAAGLALIRGRGNRLWAFGWRSAATEQETVEKQFNLLMQGLQLRADPVGEKMLLSQFHGQERKRRETVTAIEAEGTGRRPEPGAVDTMWDERFAAALGEDDPSAIAPFFTETIALEEAPYDEEMRLGASRIGGGPDLVPGTWPGDARGMRHAFLLQIDLAEIRESGGSADSLPPDGLLSVFVHDDALLADVIYTPAGSPLVHHPVTDAIIEASAAAGTIVEDLDADTPPGKLPETEGDLVTAELMADGSLQFSHTSDAVWAVGEPGARFEALSDERWATASTVRLRPRLTRTFDLHAAEIQIDETEIGSVDDLTEVFEDFDLAQTGRHAGAGRPQVHQMLGHATIRGGHDCRREVADIAEEKGWSDLTDPDRWTVLVRLRSGEATGRIFWDANDLVVMAPSADLAIRRFDRCVLLTG